MKMKVRGDVLQDAFTAVNSTTQVEAVMELKEDRWLMKSKDPAEVLLTAIRVPDTMLESYDRDGYEKIGVPLEEVNAFIESSDSVIDVWMEERAIHLDDGDTHVRRASINLESVEGRVSGVPNIQHEIELTSSPDFITDFIKRAKGVIGADHYYVGGREEGLYLYTDGDNGHIDRFYEWDEFDDVEIDWSVGNTGPGDASIPAKDEAIDVILSSDFTNEINMFDGEARIKFGNHFPMQIIYQLGDDERSGMSVAYIQTPRIDDHGQNSIPEHIRRT